METVNIKTIQQIGDIPITSAYYVKKTDDICLISIEFIYDKWMSFSGTSDGDKWPIQFIKNEDETADMGMEFVDHPNWEIFSHMVTRYGINITLLKP